MNGLVSQRRSKIYYCTFEFQGREIRRSTVVTNRKDALTVQAHIRSELALRRWGILDEHRAPARPHPERIPQRTLHHGRDQARTLKCYEFGIEKLLDSDLANHAPRLPALHGPARPARGAPRSRPICAKHGELCPANSWPGATDRTGDGLPPEGPGD
jgi:hypothetical protein